MALTSEQEGLCTRATQVYGPEKQWGMVQEECSELAAAINRRKRGRITDDQLADEVADVIVVAEQARQLVGAHRVDRIVEAKLQRLKGNMDKVST